MERDVSVQSCQGVKFFRATGPATRVFLLVHGGGVRGGFGHGGRLSIGKGCDRDKDLEDEKSSSRKLDKQHVLREKEIRLLAICRETLVQIEPRKLG